jgi:hypothetical protein
MAAFAARRLWRAVRRLVKAGRPLVQQAQRMPPGPVLALPRMLCFIVLQYTVQARNVKYKMPILCTFWGRWAACKGPRSEAPPARVA